MPNADKLNRTLFIADNLAILRGIDSESIDLIATDPPFNKGVKAFEGIVAAGKDRKGKTVSYKDVWTWGDVQAEWTESIRKDHPNLYAVIRGANAGGGEDMGAFICWLAVRVLELHRILKPTGSLYLHIDHTAHAYAKAMMDAVFGRGNFHNEIIWHYRRWTGRAKRFQRLHDTILLYSKSRDQHTFHVQYDPYTEKSLHRKQNYHTRIKDGDVYVTSIDERGVRAGDVWQIPVLNSQSKERTGYPTQKPLELYELLIKASSNEGDIVLDPFAGCATTCVAAERLGRKWIGIDLNKPARQVILNRLQTETTKSMAWGKVVKTPSKPPKRTDRGEEAAPELTLTSPKPKTPRLTARELRRRLILDDGMKCQGCGWIPHHEEYLEVDHKIPKSAGGRDDIRNRVLLCSPCNGAKGNRLTLAELREKRVEEKRMVDKAWDRAWYERTGRFA